MARWSKGSIFLPWKDSVKGACVWKVGSIFQGSPLSLGLRIWSVKSPFSAVGGCSSGGRTGHPVIGRWLLRIQDSQLSKHRWARYRTPWQPMPSVCEWMGGCDKCCQALWVVSRLEKHCRNASPFTVIRWGHLYFGVLSLATIECVFKAHFVWFVFYFIDLLASYLNLTQCKVKITC